MKDCCRREIERHLKQHRDVARCDDCGSLLLAYGNEQDFQATCDELGHHDASYETLVTETLWVVVKNS